MNLTLAQASSFIELTNRAKPSRTEQLVESDNVAKHWLDRAKAYVLGRTKSSSNLKYHSSWRISTSFTDGTILYLLTVTLSELIDTLSQVGYSHRKVASFLTVFPTKHINILSQCATYPAHLLNMKHQANNTPERDYCYYQHCAFLR